MRRCGKLGRCCLPFTRRDERLMSTAAVQSEVVPQARSASLADQGITTDRQFANVMSALMADVATGRVTPQVCNAMCNAGGKLLKIAELGMKYGTKGGAQDKVLQLADPSVQ